MRGGYLFFRRPRPPTSSTTKQSSERREEEHQVADLALPRPLAWKVGEGERGEEQQQLESQGA